MSPLRPQAPPPFLHHNPDIAGAVLQIFLQAIRASLRRVSPGAPANAQLGAVSFLYRFGSPPNPHLHFHLVVLDGVFSPGNDGNNAEARFHEAALLQPEHWTRLQGVVQRRVLRYFRTHWLLDDARPPFALERLHTTHRPHGLPRGRAQPTMFFPKKGGWTTYTYQGPQPPGRPAVHGRAGRRRAERGMREVFEIMVERLQGYTDRLDEVWATDLAALNDELRRLGLDPTDEDTRLVSQ